MYTEKEVMEYLQEGMLSEPYGDNLRYNVFLDEEGRLTSDIENADESFFAIYTGSEDSNFKFESPDNPAFVDTVKWAFTRVSFLLHPSLLDDSKPPSLTRCPQALGSDSPCPTV